MTNFLILHQSEKGALFLGKRKKTFYQRVSIHSEVSNILQVCPPAKGNFIKIGFM